ncbi:PREDICTED: uncharacterized protein LOC104791302 [Camelina sativa]|uniref:Uncharacterized protein LOC104791302 n=1 Tax=Camelina sativa TaxID=90675 RepID=A0ABM0ZGL4_CAMSA|nr:PREDICTED: uncharacterized protein LOC104791302 [Camelina sativa]
MYQQPSKTYQAATTTVFWDIDDRPKPDDIQFDDIPAHFRQTLGNLMRLRGTISINAYGDAQRIMGGRKRPNGINFNQVRSGDKDGRLQKILVDSLFWVIDHPEPSNLVLIVGTISEDSDFVKALSSLRGKDCHVFSQKAEKQGVLLSPNAWTNVNVLGRDGYMANNFLVCGGVLIYHGFLDF